MLFVLPDGIYIPVSYLIQTLFVRGRFLMVGNIGKLKS